MCTGDKVSTFRQRFTELFEESEKTITELANDLHVSNQTISAWKTGVRSPKEPTIIAIAKYFNVTVEWLMGFDVAKRIIPMQGTFSSVIGEVEQVHYPLTSEARIISGGIDKLPKEQREQALNVLQAVFAQYADYFKKGDDE